MKSSGYLYALACVVVPVVWGLLMVVVVNAFERVAARRRPDKGDAAASESASPEYYI